MEYQLIIAMIIIESLSIQLELKRQTKRNNGFIPRGSEGNEDGSLGLELDPNLLFASISR